MDAFAAIDATGKALSHWLRLLFDKAPPLCFDSDVPFIRLGAVHLPRPDGRSHLAAAAHAAAHLVYSPSAFDGAGLGAISRALVGTLEDARVEALAMRELPGLARLWRPLHTATSALGSGFEALLQRLARALADPAYDDPDAWVQKGRALFFLDANLGLAALRTPAEIRRAATLLGHDIGQMRLQHDARNHRPLPAYRDDHRWMWAADLLETEAPTTGPSGATSHDRAEPAPTATRSGATYPEWDRLISRLRPNWSHVLERSARATDDAAMAGAVEVEPPDVRLREQLRILAQRSAGCSRSDEGDIFDLGSLVDWRIARRMRRSGDPWVFRVATRRPTRAAAWLLVDRSASTSAPIEGANNVLQAEVRAAAITGKSLAAAGVACAVATFDSKGRHAVNFDVLKSFEQAADSNLTHRLGGLRPGSSTRLGAVLRHATKNLAGRSESVRWIIVFSDGEPHDIDVHDPRYLVEDARQAVRSASQQGVRIVCVRFDTDGAADAVRLFGRGGTTTLSHKRSLPRVLRRLLRR